MATATITTAPNSGSSSSSGNPTNFYAWAHAISTSWAACNWVQTADTGQIVWPTSIASISAVVANGSTAVFTYTLGQGTALTPGMTINITNCTTTALNGNNQVITATGTGTFTVATTTTVTESETAWGGVNLQQAITYAVGNGLTNTYTYTNTYGVLLAGQTVVITGCTTSGLNGTYVIGSVNSGTFTTTTGSLVTAESETATGAILCNPTNGAVYTSLITAGNNLPPPASGSVYEIWRMNDTLQATFPVFLKFEYGSSASGNVAPDIFVTVGTATDGAGNIRPGSQSGRLTLVANGSGGAQSTSTANSYFSGDTNRLLAIFWPNIASGTACRCFFSIERSHNAAGADTTDYVTISAVGNTNGSYGCNQISFNLYTATGAETKFQSILTTGTGTSGFGTSVNISPIYPIVGAVGNSTYNVYIGKSHDWTDLITFSFTSLYGTAHTYKVCNSNFINGAQALTYNSTLTAALLYRFD